GRAPPRAVCRAPADGVARLDAVEGRIGEVAPPEAPPRPIGALRAAEHANAPLDRGLDPRALPRRDERAAVLPARAEEASERADARGRALDVRALRHAAPVHLRRVDRLEQRAAAAAPVGA